MAFTVVLPREGFAADGADEGPLVGVCSEMGAEVVGAGEALGAEGTLERGRVLLDALWVAVLRAARRCLILRVCEAEDIVALVWNRGCGLPASVAWGGRTGPIQGRQGSAWWRRSTI